MTRVSMVEFRRNSAQTLQRVSKGQRLVLTLRGKPVARLEPIQAKARRQDPFYRLADLADATGKSLTNAEIDRILYVQ